MLHAARAMGGTITDLCVESSIWTHWWLKKTTITRDETGAWLLII